MLPINGARQPAWAIGFGLRISWENWTMTHLINWFRNKLAKHVSVSNPVRNPDMPVWYWNGV
jgi:hypothetical protein